MNDEEVRIKVLEGERMYPGFATAESEHEHRGRYEFAAAILSGGVVLDAACGTGYGSSFLGRTAQKVYAVDSDPGAIAFAKEHFSNPVVEFRVGDILHLDFPDSFFDVVVALEMLEHLLEQDELLTEFKRVLKPGGTLILSTPDKTVSAQISVFLDMHNRFHVKELTKDELVLLLQKYFTVKRLLGYKSVVIPGVRQRFFAFVLRCLKKTRLIGLVRRLVGRKIKEKALDATLPFEKEWVPRDIPLDVKNNSYNDLIVICRKM
jgi:ubiquinone/menaquinone biosynthesis C-methylase UbiE